MIPAERVESQATKPNIPQKETATVTTDISTATSTTIDNGYVYGNATITTDSEYRYIKSNGLPDHDTGQFPNSNNPNTISEQNHNYRVTLNPKINSSTTEVRLSGVSLNGLPLEPGTAETYNGDINWAIEAINPSDGAILGLDWSNAHVQPNGTYHYHGTPEGLLGLALEDQNGDLVQVAWAPDGFPVYYSQGDNYTSSWQVKSGTRPDGPGGSYDGTYKQDYEFVSGSGKLDACNGAIVDGEYIYFVTSTFPFYGRCTSGTPDESFAGFGPGTGGNNNQAGPNGNNQPGTSGQRQRPENPPQEAITACLGESKGSQCSVKTPQGTLNGTCQTPGGGTLACIPQ